MKTKTEEKEMLKKKSIVNKRIATDAKRYGVGISLFFGFTKSSLACIFFIIILKVLLFMSLYDQHSPENYFPYPKEVSDSGYFQFTPRKYLLKYTYNIGSLAFNRHRFYEFSLFQDSQDYVLESNGVMKLGSEGTKDGQILLSILPIDQDSSMTFESHQTSCNDGEKISKNLIEKCQDKSICEFTFNQGDFFKQSCIDSGELSGKKLSIKIRGSQSKVQFLFLVDLNQDYFTIIYIGISAFIFAVLSSQTKRFQNSQTRSIVKKETKFPDPSDYTVEITNIPLNDCKTEQDILFDVKSYFGKFFFESDFQKSKNKNLDTSSLMGIDFIVDICTTYEIEMNRIEGKIYKIRKEIQEKYAQLLHICEMFKRGIKKKFPERCNYFKRVEEIVNNHGFSKGKVILLAENLIFFLETLVQILMKDIKLKDQELQKAIDRRTQILKKKKTGKTGSVFVQFETMEAKDYFISEVESGSQRSLYERAGRLKLRHPENPVNLNWDMYTPGASEPSFRRFILWVLTIILMFIRKLDFKQK